MSDNERVSKRLSRRDLLRIACMSGLTVATGSFATPFSRSVLATSEQNKTSEARCGCESPHRVLATRNQDDTPESFLAWAYAQRAQAMTAKDLKLVEAIYDPASADLVAFERERLLLDIGSRWNGTMLGYSSTISLIDLSLSDAIATARVYEKLGIEWRQNPVEISEALLKERQGDPEKFTPLPQGLQGEIFSSMGIRHEVTLERHKTGWKLVRDAYEEPFLLAGSSPDLIPGSWAAVHSGTARNSDIQFDSPPPLSSTNEDVNLIATYSYKYWDAKYYAQRHCLSYNPDYCNFNGNCGGDCANFVSQCFRFGGQVDDSIWRTYNGICGAGNCPTFAKPNAGNDTWANNVLLRNWVMNSGRGYNAGDLGYLGMGDVINYDWGCSGQYDHVTIMVQAMYPNGALICSHNSDLCNAPWDMGGACSYAYTALYSSYSA